MTESTGVIDFEGLKRFIDDFEQKKSTKQPEMEDLMPEEAIEGIEAREWALFPEDAPIRVLTQMELEMEQLKTFLAEEFGEDYSEDSSAVAFVETKLDDQDDEIYELRKLLFESGRNILDDFLPRLTDDLGKDTKLMEILLAGFEMMLSTANTLSIDTPDANTCVITLKRDF